MTDLIKFLRLSVFSPRALVASAFALLICVLTILLCTPIAEDETLNYGLTAKTIIPNRFHPKIVSSLSIVIAETLAIFFMYTIDKISPSPYGK